MKKILSKAILMLLIAVMAVSTVGCSCNDDDGLDGVDAEQTPADKDSWLYKDDEEITIEWYVDTPSFSYAQFGSDKVSQVIKEKTGINIKFTAPVDNDGQYLSNLIAADSLPDVVTVSAYTPIKDRMSSQNLIYPIDDLVDKWAPSLKNRIEKDIHAYYELADKKIYGLPSNSYSSETSDGRAYSPNGGFLVRKDLYNWYVTKYPNADVMTKDGFFNMVKTVVQTFNYSTGTAQEIDGIKQIKNMSGILLDQFNGEGNKSVEWLSQYFAAPFESTDGKYIDSRTTPQYKEAVKFLNDAYHQGLIKPSNMDANATEIGGTIANGAAFCSMVTAQDYSGSFIAAYDEGKGFEYIPIIFTNAAGDDPILQDLQGYGYLFNMITKNAKRPDRIIKLFDFLWSDEGQMLCNFGIENETYKYTDETKTKIEYTQDYINMKRDGTLFSTYGVERMWLFIKSGVFEQTKPTNAYKKDYLYFENLKKPLMPISYSYTPSMPPLDVTSGDYNKIINQTYSVDVAWAENLTLMITAESGNFDETFDGVLADMNRQGLNKVVDFYNLSYKSFVEKVGLDRGWPAYRSGFTSKIKNGDGTYKISPNGDFNCYLNVTPID